MNIKLRLLGAPVLALAALCAATVSAEPLRRSQDNPRYFATDETAHLLLTGSHNWHVFQAYQNPAGQTDDDDLWDNNWLGLMAAWQHNFFRGWFWSDNYYRPLPWRWDSKQDCFDLSRDPELTLGTNYVNRMLTRVGETESVGLFTSVMLFQGWSHEERDNGAGPLRIPDPWNGAIPAKAHPWNGNNCEGFDADMVPGNDGNDAVGLELQQWRGPNDPVWLRQKDYIHAMVDAMNPYENFLWEVCNECRETSVEWQEQVIAAIRQREAALPNQHLVWMSCPGNNDFIQTTAADVVSPCKQSGNWHSDPPEVLATGPLYIVDTDHINVTTAYPERLWRWFVRGGHPIYMDAEFDLSWIQNGTPLQNFDEIRDAMATMRDLAETRLDLASLVPQKKNGSAGFPASSELALYSTATPLDAQPPPDGREFLAFFNDSSAGSLTVSGLTVGAEYTTYQCDMRGQGCSTGGFNATSDSRVFSFAERGFVHLESNLPAPLYSDNFNDAGDGVNLNGRELPVGGAIWQADAGLKTGGDEADRKVTTVWPNGKPVGGIPYHLTSDFAGVASVEAELTLGPATSVSVGFSSSPVDFLADAGVFWVSLAGGNIYVYGSGATLLGTINPLVAVTEGTLRLTYDAGASELRLFSQGGFLGGWSLLLTIPVSPAEIDYAVLEIDRGTTDESFVDDFAVRLTEAP